MIDGTLAREFGLETTEAISEEDLLRMLESRLDILMRTEAMRLLQILYRMDVDERAAEAAMDSANPAASMARLVLDRVRLRAATRTTFRPPPVNGEDADLVL